MEILITGTSGFLGGDIFSYLNQNHNHNVFTLNRYTGDYKVDLSNSRPVFQNSFDVVIHCAGMAHKAPINELISKSFFDVNLLGTSNLLNGLSSNYPPKQFVFISSVSVYGLNIGSCLTENMPLTASDPYGKSKIEAEEIVLKWCIENNVICTILRLPLLVGQNPPGNLGMMVKAIKKGYYFNISGGESRKSMVLASDVSKFVLKASSVGGIYNLTDGHHPSFNELSRFIGVQLGKIAIPSMPMFFASRLAFFGDIIGPKFPINSDKLNKIISTLTFDDSRARNAFGWAPTPVLKGFKIR